MSFKPTYAWIFAVALTLSTPARADLVTIDWASPVINPGPADSFSWSGSSPAGSGSALAGRFHGKVTGFSGAITGDEFVDSMLDLWAYCYDLLQYLHDGTYTVDYSVQAATLNFLGAVNYVQNGNSNAWVDPHAWLHPSTANIATAVQAGIWESLYDSGFDLASGALILSGLEPAAIAQYDLFKAAAANPSVNDLPASLVMRFVSDGNQDVITGRPPRNQQQQVPEPGSLLLFGLGAALVGWMRRRWH